MSVVVEKRRATIINVLYFALLLAAFYCAFKWLLPLFLPFIFAFITASIINRPITAITKKTPLKRSLLSASAVVLLLVAIAAIFFLIGIEMFERISGFYDYLVAQLQNISILFNDLKLWILDFTSFLPESVRTVLHENVTLFFDNIIQNGFENISIDTSMIDWSALLSKGGEVLTGTVGKIPSLLIAFVIFLISTVFISSDYERIKEFFVKQAFAHHMEKLSTAWHLGVSSLKKMLKAYALIILITTFELTVGLYIMKFIGLFDNQYIIFIALGIAIIDIIPVLGTGTVLIPWAVISFITNKIGLGIALLIIYVIILVIRQIIEPKLVAGQVGLPSIVTIIAMYVGSKTLGVLGFFILPFIVILIKVFNDAGLIVLFRNRHSEETEQVTETSSQSDV
ncbi:MAG: sporulation integral membrane protein YtvI [Clostridia bacterium]|nr:sporulation integral membrane protein YtvI [Clostridia bacterium]